jgi:hypothetical protein
MKRYLLAAALAVSAYAQVPAPDCIASFTLSAAGSQTGFTNQGCIFWTMTYRNFGFTGLSLTLQQAPDANNAPGTWKTFTGTGEVGSNPSTSITGAYYTIIASDTDLAAWVRVNLSGLTGTGFVTGYAFGYKTYPGASGGGGGGGGGIFDPCQTNARNPTPISITSSTKIIPLSAGKKTYVCYLQFALNSTADNVALVEGTTVSTPCDTATAGMAGGTTAATGWNLLANGSVTSGAISFWAFATATASHDVCLLVSSGAQLSGVVQYVQQ